MEEINRILVVDDDDIVSSYLKSLLENEGYNVTIANNGSSALEILNTNNYNLVLLDILMPGMDGYEVLSRIRKTSDIPVIMVTSVTDPISAAKSLDIGADDYIRKPFVPRVIIAQINAKLRRKRS